MGALCPCQPAMCCVTPDCPPVPLLPLLPRHHFPEKPVLSAAFPCHRQSSAAPRATGPARGHVDSESWGRNSVLIGPHAFLSTIWAKSGLPSSSLPSPLTGAVGPSAQTGPLFRKTTLATRSLFLGSSPSRAQSPPLSVSTLNRRTVKMTAAPALGLGCG